MKWLTPERRASLTYPEVRNDRSGYGLRIRLCRLGAPDYVINYVARET